LSIFLDNFFVRYKFQQAKNLFINIKALCNSTQEVKKYRQKFILDFRNFYVAVSSKKASVDEIGAIGDRDFLPLPKRPVYPHYP